MKHNKLYLIIITILVIFLFKNNEVIQSSILNSCLLFITKLFPSLFPMMIMSDLFIYFKGPYYLYRIFGNVFEKIFHTSPYGVFAFFMSCISGSPTNAYTIKNLAKENYLSEEEASYILSFSFFSNPLFLYTMLNLIFENNIPLVLFYLLLPYLVNILIGIMMRKKKNKTQIDLAININKTKDFGTYLSQSIKNAMNTLLLILGSVSFFFLINALINPFNNPFISGFLEISQGLNVLLDYKGLDKIKKLLTIIFISFGGLSIHLQIKGIISDTNISYKEFLKGRIMQTILSVGIVFFLT